MTFTPEIRKKCMKSNTGKNTGPELMLRKMLREIGLGGYRLHWKVPGRPDICYPCKRIAIFVNGCFWHRCPKCNPPIPQTNVQFWQDKFNKNIWRDTHNYETLSNMGWTVIIIWECELKNEPVLVIKRISDVIAANQRILSK